MDMEMSEFEPAVEKYSSSNLKIETFPKTAPASTAQFCTGSTGVKRQGSALSQMGGWDSVESTEELDDEDFL
jgi:hypothetical protein